MVPQSPLPVDPGTLRATLTAVPGVLDVHVDESGIRLDIRPEAEPAQVEHDVRSLLLHVFGIDLSGQKPSAGDPEVVSGSGDLPRPREIERSAVSLVLPSPRLTMIRGGLGVPPLHALAGAVPVVPDLDLDMLREIPPRTAPTTGEDRREAVGRRQAMHLRERSAYVPPLFETEIPRPVLVRLRTESSPSQISLSVALRFAGLLLEGTAESAPNAEAARDAVVEATLGALRSVLSAEVQLSGAAVAIVELGGAHFIDPSGVGTLDVFGIPDASASGDDVAIVRVRLDSQSGFEDLVGVSTVRADSRAAIARATLDAVNRRIASLYRIQ